MGSFIGHSKLWGDVELTDVCQIPDKVTSDVLMYSSLGVIVELTTLP